MLKIISSAGQNISISAKHLESEIGKLQAANERGVQFLILPIQDIFTSIKWILASFYSPVIIVPVSAQLPQAGLVEIIAALPQNK